MAAPLQPQPYAKPWLGRAFGNDRLFSTLLILQTLLKQCATMQAFATAWRQRVENLIDHPPSVGNAMHLMGVTSTWKAHPCWV